MDDIVRKDIPPETPNDRLTTPHLPARDPKDQVEQPDTRGRALTHAQHQSHGGQPNSPRHHQQIGASRLSTFSSTWIAPATDPCARKGVPPLNRRSPQ
jgi:hypothetical protein